MLASIGGLRGVHKCRSVKLAGCVLGRAGPVLKARRGADEAEVELLTNRNMLGNWRREDGSRL
jgi:hypothetical protein